jgi:hypothetical protein
VVKDSEYSIKLFAQNPRKTRKTVGVAVETPPPRPISGETFGPFTGCRMLQRAIDSFFLHEASGGILLILSAVAAMLVANSPLL